MHAILTRTITLVLDRKLFSRRIFLLIEIRTELRELGFFETTLTVHGARAPRLLVSTCHRHTIRMLTRCRTYSIYILACCCAVLPTCAETRLGRAALRLQGPAAATGGSRKEIHRGSVFTGFAVRHPRRPHVPLQRSM